MNVFTYLKDENDKIKLLKGVCNILYLVILNNNLFSSVYSINYGLQVDVPIILVLINIFSESLLYTLISYFILQYRKELLHALKYRLAKVDFSVLQDVMMAHSLGRLTGDGLHL